MKIDSLFRIKDAQMNQLDDELNDLLAHADDTDQEILFKIDQMAELRTQLELYDPHYKTEMEKVKRSDTNKCPEYPEEEIPF
jgi:hypothetical protein